MSMSKKPGGLQMFAFMSKGLLVSFAGSTRYCLKILPIDFLISNTNGSKAEATPMIDRIINVSAAFVNLFPGIVPLDYLAVKS